MTEQTQDRLIGLVRFIVLIPMILFGNQIRFYLQSFWTDHWLRKDGTPTQAVITEVHPKRVFNYHYNVDGKRYLGTSSRAWEEEKAHPLRIGDETTVFFSGSHPWLSSMQTVRVAWVTFPLVVLLLLLEAFFLAILIDPKGRWSVSRWFLNN